MRRFLALEKIKQRYKDSHHSVLRAAFNPTLRRADSRTTYDLSRVGSARFQQNSPMSMTTAVSTSFRPHSSYLRDSAGNQSSTPRSYLVEKISVPNLTGRLIDSTSTDGIQQKPTTYHPNARIKFVHSAPVAGSRTSLTAPRVGRDLLLFD